jgi:hypothetical protein
MSILVELPLGSFPSRLPPSSGNVKRYDFATARRMMWFSQLAYESADPHKIDTVLDIPSRYLAALGFKL